MEPLRDAKLAAAKSGNISLLADVENAMAELDSAGPFSAAGFFSIEKSTVMSIVGYSITYLIVLVQFRVSEKTS